jgi:hypothetical protein
MAIKNSQDHHLTPERSIAPLLLSLPMLLRQIGMLAAALGGLLTHLPAGAARMPLAAALGVVLVSVLGSAALEQYAGREHGQALVQPVLCAGLAFSVGCLLGILLLSH